jgi:hypothetical protein
VFELIRLGGQRCEGRLEHVVHGSSSKGPRQEPTEARRYDLGGDEP